jgi:redox-sensing transcriptional repressor
VKGENKVGRTLGKGAGSAASKLPVRPSPDAVSELTTNRLSVYLRCLNTLDAAGVSSVSSQALAEQFNLNAAQIRKDLAHFGEFGVRGVGYYVKELRRHLREILGLDRRVRVAIMGAGNLGLALADYPGFRAEGFEIAALFDTMREKIGQRSRAGVPIHDARDFKRIVRREGIAIAAIAVPAPAAQAVVNSVVAAGIKAVLNFSPGTLTVPPDVKLKSVDLTVSLESLSFFLAQVETACGESKGRSRPAGGVSRRPALFRTSTPKDACGWSTSPPRRSPRVRRSREAASGCRARRCVRCGRAP